MVDATPGSTTSALGPALAGGAEGVHQVRVALRRLRVWLAFKGHRSLQEELRWLCGCLALLRDLDVFGEALTPQALAELRPEAVARAVEALGSERWVSLRDRLNSVRPPRRSQAKRALPRLERKLDELRASRPRSDGEALHRMRRALRRVRYAREWLGLDTADLAQEQERLGAVCDLLALQAFARWHQAAVPPQLDDAIARGFELLSPHGNHAP